ncbi:MAG: chloride channel protein, partial [Rubrivivax sp.]
MTAAPGPHDHPDWQARLREEFTEWRPWVTRGVVLAFAAAAGVCVAFFTWLSDQAYHLFTRLEAAASWAPLLWMPACAATIVWLTRRFLPGVGAPVERAVGAVRRKSHVA